MRTFVRTNDRGEILSVARVNVIPEGVDNPYADLGEGELVIEIEATEPFKEMPISEIHENYKVDVSKKKLVKKPIRRPQ